MSQGWPLLRRAPARLLHDRALAAMVFVSVALLAGLVSAGPLFASAAGFAAVGRRLAAVPPSSPPDEQPAIQVAGFGPSPEIQARIQSLIAGVPYMAPPVTTLIAHSWQSANDQGVTPYIRVGGVRVAALLCGAWTAPAGSQVGVLVCGGNCEPGSILG